jgi:putative lipoprotein
VKWKLALFAVAIAATANAQLLKEKDKQLHFISGSFASSVGYSYVWKKTKDKKKALLAGIGTAILAGTVKELIDSSEKNNYFDIRDLTATTLGGITVSVTINLFNNDKSNKKLRKRRLGLFVVKNNNRRKSN